MLPSALPPELRSPKRQPVRPRKRPIPRHHKQVLHRQPFFPEDNEPTGTGSICTRLRSLLKVLHELEQPPQAVPMPLTTVERSHAIALVGWARIAIDKVHAEVIHAPAIRTPLQAAAVEALGATLHYSDVVKEQTK